MYQISRNALEDGTFSDAMTVDVAIDQIYAEPSSPGMIPVVASGNGNGERNCMCKNSGKISVFSVRCSEGGRKVLEIIVEVVERYWKG